MKYLYFLVLAIIIAPFSSAQTKGSVELGLQGSLGFSNISGFDRDTGFAELTYDPIFAYGFGGTAEYYFSEKWGIKTRVNFERKGYGDELFSQGSRGAFFFSDIHLDYITVPITATYHFGSKLDYYVNIGAYAGFLQNATAQELDLDLTSDFSSTDFGITFSLGYRFQVASNAKFFIELDNQSGVVDLFEDDFGNNFRLNRTSLNLGVVFIL
ncbi:MAG: porin family protein [Nonlabens sp.]